MRENIGLYRGKRKDNDEWVYWNIYGELTAENGKRKKYTITKGAKTRCYYYIYQLKQAIIPESIGEYTGLTDKNGKKIFEGDILQFGERKMSVFWNGETFSWEMQDVETLDSPVNHLINTVPLGEVQVEWCYGEMSTFIIGSIHDNNELLKGGAEE